MHDLIAAGRVSAAHDVSDGGIAVALAEMAIAGQLGLTATIPHDGDDAGPLVGATGNGSEASGAGSPLSMVAALANEAPGRLLLEAPAAERAAVAARLGRLGRLIGMVTGTGEIEIHVAAGPHDSPTSPMGGSSPATVTVAAARRAFGCHSPPP